MMAAMPAAPAGSAFGIKPGSFASPQGATVQQASHASQETPALLLPLQGVWSSDCGQMAILGKEVRDGNGSSAELKVTPEGNLQLCFGGEKWNAKRIARDLIEWEGEGGMWTRDQASGSTSPPAPRIRAALPSVTVQ